jgi:hypothetical protein
MVMTTTEPLTNANLETTSYNHESSSSAIASKKEEDTVLEIPEKKVKRSYNKKKSTL